jgi:ribonuclease HI
MKIITLHVDGSCLSNGSENAPGGYGIVLQYLKHTKHLSGYIPDTTNNRAEIVGCIEGLNALKEPCQVLIITDSQYVVNTMTKGWKTNANTDLWERLREACERHKVTWKWVRGHMRNSLNEVADTLAQLAASKGALCESVSHYGKRM